MTKESILGAAKLVAFVPTIDPAKARAFYEDVLGLGLVEDAKPFALVFDANGTMLRVTTVRELHPRPVHRAGLGRRIHREHSRGSHRLRH